MNGKKKFPVFRVVLCAVLAVLMIAANGAVWYFQGYLDNMYTIYEAEGGSTETVTYEQAIAHGNVVSSRILQEGSVLLKNDNNTSSITSIS